MPINICNGSVLYTDGRRSVLHLPNKIQRKHSLRQQYSVVAVLCMTHSNKVLNGTRQALDAHSEKLLEFL